MRSIGFALITALMIFSAVLMTILAVTAYQRAEAELRLVESFADSVSDYYSADSAAVVILSRLKNSTDIEKEVSAIREDGYVINVETGAEGEVAINYSVGVNDDSTLDVTLRLKNREWRVLKWSVEHGS